MAIVRRLYPEELMEHIRSEIQTNLEVPLGLATVDTGDELSFIEQAPNDLVPAVMIDILEDEPTIGQPLGHVDVEYVFMVSYIRHLADDDRPKSGLLGPTRELREFFMVDAYTLPTFNAPGHKIISAFPGRAVYGEPQFLREHRMHIEQSSFPLIVKARSNPITIP